MPPSHTRAHLPASAIAQAIDAERLARILEPWISDAGERAFVARCIAHEGPIHHRGASFSLLSLVQRIADRVGMDPGGEPGISLPMRVPPHAHTEPIPAFPLALDPSAAVVAAGGDAERGHALSDALTDGPPHHLLANVAMANLLRAILRHLERDEAPT